ncbi:hypothetical protein PHYBOEH_009283 [Phytophthora boehmeriae]|uniref:F-box domain-containing protein n=1 Tax=Phytophthora boehmeriae TaxID=109152 RepID=A0A8T1X207_9STRA|nr:hypothetical protein PHYBOEH_009283 [Phytophthora boehmeriae]
MSSSAAAPAASVAADISRTVELLAPLYVEVCQDAAGGATAVPVSFRRTAADGVKFVFANVERDVACVHNANGCRCDFERFFKALAELTERRILQVDATYVVAARAFGQPRVATLQIRVRVHEQAKQGTSLKDFDFVLSHLQATVLSIIPQNEQARRTAVTSALDDARNSSCHVVGCRLHPQDITKLATQPERKLNLPEVFYSLTSQKEVDQMEVRDDVTYLTRMTQPKKQVVITDFPSNVLQNIVCMMEARELASLSGVCSMFQHMAYEDTS